MAKGKPSLSTSFDLEGTYVASGLQSHRAGGWRSFPVFQADAQPRERMRVAVNFAYFFWLR